MEDNPDVLGVLRRYPDDVRDGLLRLRSLIIEIAGADERIGTLEETLKWGQPSYLTVRPKSGTTVRIDRDNSEKGDIALYVNCQTRLVSDWRGMFPELVFGGDRSLHLSLAEPLPEPQLRQMIAMALTYHRRPA